MLDAGSERLTGQPPCADFSKGSIEQSPSVDHPAPSPNRHSCLRPTRTRLAALYAHGSELRDVTVSPPPPNRSGTFR